MLLIQSMLWILISVLDMLWIIIIIFLLYGEVIEVLKSVFKL